ncbi:hypothetical protein [Comamonas sp. JUb58]|nr:hypothetical protein [Comamonas sp. JUb58]TDS78780.1 hypothetical protein EDF71_111128 [Comamonas sp. JUb58]
MNDPTSSFSKLQSEDTRQERRLVWAELLVIVVTLCAALALVLAIRQ